MPTLPSQCWTPLSPIICISFSSVSCSLFSWTGEPQWARTGEKPAAICLILEQRVDVISMSLQPSPVWSHLELSNILLQYDCCFPSLWRNKCGRDSIYVHVIRTRQGPRTSGKNRQRCWHKCWCIVVRWVIGGALESNHIFLHAWTVLTVKTAHVPTQDKGFFVFFYVHAGVAKCLFWLFFSQVVL